jgi:hypothetical protein
MLNTRGRLGARVHQTTDRRLIERAREGLTERVTGRAQVVVLDRFAGAKIHRAPSRFRQARRASERLTNGDSFEPRDVNINEVRVHAAKPSRRAGAAILSRMLVIQFDETLVRSLHALQLGERRVFFTFLTHHEVPLPDGLRLWRISIFVNDLH